jgi:oligosaccharide repeat unit polymerase
VAPDTVVRSRRADPPRLEGGGRAQITVAIGTAGIALFAWGAQSVTANRAAILVCAVLWVALGIAAMRKVILSSGPLAKFVCLFGVTYWFWIEAAELALAEAPFVVSHASYHSLGGTYPPGLVAAGVFGVTLFGLCLLVGYHAFKPSRLVQRTVMNRWDRVSGSWLDAIAFGLSVVGWIPAVIAVGGDFGWLMERLGDMRTYQVTGLEKDPGLAGHFGLLSVAGGALGLARFVGGRRGSRALQSLAFLNALVWVFSTGSRFNLGYLALPALFALVALIRHSSGRGEHVLRMKLLALAVALGVGLILQGALRDVGIVEGRSYLDETSAVGIAKHGGFGHEQFSAALSAIEFADQRGEYFLEPMTPHFLIHFIPRALWPNKPYVMSWMAYNDEVTGGAETYNVTPSVIGQYYLNWGFVGVALIGLFLGALGRLLDATLAALHPEGQFLGVVVCGMWIVFLFLSFRFFHPLYVTFPVAGTVTYLLLSRRRMAMRP